MRYRYADTVHLAAVVRRRDIIADVRGELMSEKLEINPRFGVSARFTTQNVEVKSAGRRNIFDFESVVKRAHRSAFKIKEK